jgi:phosphate-selective porin OprO and OprP
MNRTFYTLVFLTLPLGAALAGDSVAEAPQDDKITFETYWKNGLRIESSDKATKIQIGGRLFNDWSWFTTDEAVDTAVGEHENGTEMRAARIYLKGTIDERYFFKVNYDFASTKAGDGGPAFKDVYMGLKQVPGLQNVKVGHYKEPMGLDVLTSSKYTTFMERSLTASHQPSRNTGIMASGGEAEKRMTYAAGIFRDADKFGKGGGNGDYAFTGRVTGLPMTNKDHTSMIHLGVAYSYRKHDSGSVGFSLRPESHLAPKYVDTGSLAADASNVVGLEWASVTGPFYTQAEYVNIDVDGSTGASSPTFASYYGQLSWFPTGDHKKYDAKNGAFGRVSPKNPWGKGGWGAWELAVRYSTTDLNDADVTGGELTDITAGVNWYLASHARIMANYINADLDTVGSSDIVMFRFQIDF